jgi:hypothetical protein
MHDKDKHSSLFFAATGFYVWQLACYSSWLFALMLFAPKTWTIKRLVFCSAEAKLFLIVFSKWFGLSQSKLSIS